VLGEPGARGASGGRVGVALVDGVMGNIAVEGPGLPSAKTDDWGVDKFTF